jgi:hypothetical protein
VLFGLPIIPRSEFTGARRERVPPQVGVIAGVLQWAAALTAVWIGAFARPLGVALFGAILLGYRYHQRLVYGSGDLGSSRAGERTGTRPWGDTAHEVSSRAVPDQLRREQRHEPRVTIQVPPPETPRFVEEAEDPLEAEALQDRRRLPLSAGEEVERRPDTDHDRLDSVLVLGHPAFLLGAPKPTNRIRAPDRLMPATTRASSSGVSGRNGGLCE